MSHAEDDMHDDMTVDQAARKLLNILEQRAKAMRAKPRPRYSANFMFDESLMFGDTWRGLKPELSDLWATAAISRAEHRTIQALKDGKMSMNMTAAIVGSQYHRGADEQLRRMENMRHRDTRIFLQLVREPDNEHDRCAVAVYHLGVHLGYVPRQDARIVAKVMDAGIRVHAWYMGNKEMKIWWPASDKRKLDEAYQRAMG